MVRQDDECFEVVVLQMLRAVVDGIHYQLRDGLLFQVERSTTGGVEISVHPDKGWSRILFVWRRVERVWQAPVEMPRDKQALAFRPYVGKSTSRSEMDHLRSVVDRPKPDQRAFNFPERDFGVLWLLRGPALLPTSGACR